MPAPTNSERIDGLLRITSDLDARMKAVQGDLDERVKDVRGDHDAVKKSVDEVRNHLHRLETQFARMEEALKHAKERLERPDPSERLARVEEGLKAAREKLDQRDSRCFEFIKIIAGAFVVAIVGGAVGAGYQWLPKLFESMSSHRGSQAVKKQ